MWPLDVTKTHNSSSFMTSQRFANFKNISRPSIFFKIIFFSYLTIFSGGHKYPSVLSESNGSRGQKHNQTLVRAAGAGTEMLGALASHCTTTFLR